MGLLVALALGWFQTAAARPSCLRTDGKTACGFGCLAAHGRVACARTAPGVCAATGDGVVCWDPPPAVRAHYGDRTPRPRCITRAGHTECGYHCQAHDDDVACAGTPDGICRATGRGVTCWDPPPTSYFCDDERPPPRPSCVVLDDEVACGYACQVRNGQMACAQTPDGVCTVADGGIICMDPDAPASCADPAAASAPAFAPAPR